MPTNAQIGDVSEELSATVTELRSFLERAESEEKSRGEQSQETKAAVEAIDARIDELEVSLKRRIQEYDARHNGTAGLDEAKAAERKAFVAFMRKGEESMAPEDRKALSVDSDPDGGFLVSENVRAGIIEILRETSPIRDLATVETISQGDSLTFHVEVGDFDAGWVSEREARPATNTGTTGKETIYAHEIYAAPRASQQILDDSAYDLESWIQRKVADKFARVENTAFVNGDGEGKPFGILTDDRIATVNSGHASQLTADGLIDLIYDLPEFYAANASFLLKRASLKAIRKFKDSQGQYLWTQGFDKTPATILGYGYREAVDMPTIGAGAKAVIFGDFRRGYVVLDRQQVRVLRDPYTAKPFVEFYTTKRVGGKVVLPEALRTQTVAA
ncbi:MAG TPA: phage major capsid protein [Agromyces sp.]